MIRLFYHHNYPGVWMLDNSEETPTAWQVDNGVVILSRDEINVGYNLLKMPELRNGHHYLDDDKLQLINERFVKAGLPALAAEVNPLYVGAIIDFENITEQVKVVRVDIGKATIQIVTTAGNIVAGQKVVVALAGAVLYNGDIIRESKIYDQLSQGVFVSKHSLWGKNEDLGMILVLAQETEKGIIFKKPGNKEELEC